MTDTKHCGRAHPHENMSFACSLRAISAQVRCAPETATPEFLSVAADAIDKAAGCWILTDAGDVFVQYGDGRSRIYPGTGWTIAKPPKRPAPAKPAPRKRLPVTEF